jgi:hypothetical protein
MSSMSRVDFALGRGVAGGPPPMVHCIAVVTTGPDAPLSPGRGGRRLALAQDLPRPTLSGRGSWRCVLSAAQPLTNTFPAGSVRYLER